MEYILVAIVFLFIGMCLMALISANKITNLENKNARLADQLGQRNKIINDYIGKYFEITQIIKRDTEKNEFAVITVNKLKEVIEDNQSTNNF